MEIETYKNWEIEYIEETEKFVAGRLENSSLKELKNKIKNFSFKREKVYYWTREDELKEAEITSKIEDSYNPMQSNHGVKNSDLYLFNKKNKEIFEKITKLHEEKIKLIKEIENLKKTLDSFKEDCYEEEK